jgi:hypothetical protein
MKATVKQGDLKIKKIKTGMAIYFFNGASWVRIHLNCRKIRGFMYSSDVRILDDANGTIHYQGWE